MHACMCMRHTKNLDVFIALLERGDEGKRSGVPERRGRNFVHKCSDVTKAVATCGHALQRPELRALGTRPPLAEQAHCVEPRPHAIDFNRMEAAPSPGLVAVAPTLAERGVARSDEGRPPEPCRRRIVLALTLLHIERDAGHGRMCTRPARRAMSVTFHIRKLQSLHCV